PSRSSPRPGRRRDRLPVTSSLNTSVLRSRGGQARWWPHTRRTTMNPTCSGPVPGTPVGMLGAFDLSRHGYAVEEWFLAGTASSWRAAHELGYDGRWAGAAADSGPFQTRLLVCMPADPSRFGGTARGPRL